jgi:D-aminoacyl-tRNA deacylase
MILLVASNKDIASLNIKNQILSHYPFKETTESFQENPLFEAEVNGKKLKLVTLNQESVYAQELPSFFEGLELIVFISRHSSESGTPTLSVHAPGNLGVAELGGLPRRVSVSPANCMRDALGVMMRLKEDMKLGYEVSYECTHHGPSLDLPAMFAELGSSSEQWGDSEAAGVVAHAVMEAVSKFGEFEAAVVLGVGGPHYNGRFTRLALEDQIAFGHMIPKYAIPYVDLEILRQCVGKTLEKVEHAVLDWKGIRGEHKSRTVKMLEELGLPIQRI